MIYMYVLYSKFVRETKHDSNILVGRAVFFFFLFFSFLFFLVIDRNNILHILINNLHDLTTLTTGKNEKVHSSHVSAMKIIGKKWLV